MPTMKAGDRHRKRGTGTSNPLFLSLSIASSLSFPRLLSSPTLFISLFFSSLPSPSPVCFLCFNFWRCYFTIDVMTPSTCVKEKRTRDKCEDPRQMHRRERTEKKKLLHSLKPHWRAARNHIAAVLSVHHSPIVSLSVYVFLNSSFERSRRGVSFFFSLMNTSLLESITWRSMQSTRERLRRMNGWMDGEREKEGGVEEKRWGRAKNHSRYFCDLKGSIMIRIERVDSCSTITTTKTEVVDGQCARSEGHPE